MQAPPPQRRTVLITDLVDSTKLAAELGDARVVEVWLAHDRAARDLLPLYDGREVDKSDGFLMLFERPLDGVRYALAYHRALVRLSAELGLRLRARAGLHEGEVSVIRTPERDVALGAKQWEVEGMAKPMAARIMSVALGGQTLLSASTRQAILEEDPEFEGEPIRFQSHGHYRMKGVPAPLEIVEAAVRGSPLQPPPDAAKVYRVVPADGDWRPAREVPNNLPPPRAGFFGRVTELRAIGDALDEGARLLTLVGPGGIGKTTLSGRFAAAWLGDWPGGAWLADLSEARTAADITRALGAALSVPLDQADAAGTLGAALRSRGRTLILLDNFEQVVRFAPETVGRWLDLAPEAAFLVTSRLRLGLRGERILPVEPLPLPPPEPSLSALEESPAAALFLERARAVQPSLALDEAQVAAVARLVALLDGLPLAIELAAARARMLPPTKILERMGRRFDLLRGGARGAPDRQATLRGAIDGSWELAEPHQRLALSQLAVFEGSFDLEAAEAALDLSEDPDAPWALDVLEALVEQSLLQRREVQGEPRFSLLQSIQEYAWEKLDEPARRAAEARHAAWYARWGEERSIQDQSAQPHLRARLELDLDNVLAAARRGEGEPAALAALGALQLLSERGPFALASEIVERALPLARERRTQARLRVSLGVVRARSGQPEAALEPLQEALATARALGLRWHEAQALGALGQAALLRGALSEARARYEEALALYRGLGDARGEAGCLAELAHVIGIRGGDHDLARPLLEAALALHARRHDEAGEAVTRSHLGAILAIKGDFEGALLAYGRARDLAKAVGDRRTEGLCEGMIAAVLGLLGRGDEARGHFEAALRVQSSIGDRVHEAMHAVNYGDLLARLGEDAAARRWLEHAVTLARETANPTVEGSALGALGTLHLRSGELTLARERLTRGEALLRESDPAELGKLLCTLGRLELRGGARPAALARVGEARAILERLGLADSSELGVLIAALEAELS